MSTPGREWLSKLEGLCLLHPSLVNQGKKLYLAKVARNVLCLSYCVILFFVGAFWPKVGLYFGNFFNVHGVAGQMISFSGALIVGLVVYLRIRWVADKNIGSFIYEVIAYDDDTDGSNNDSNGQIRHNRTLLHGDSRFRMKNFSKKT